MYVYIIYYVAIYEKYDCVDSVIYMYHTKWLRSTVEPLYSGQSWDSKIKGGILISRVVLYTVLHVCTCSWDHAFKVS